MRWYHYILIILKVAFLVEFALVLYDKKLVHPIVYITTEILFKLLLSLYMQYILFFITENSIAFEDKLIVSFAGGLLGYDALVNDLPDLLDLYGISNTSLIR
jgi:hypothetical protein